MGGLDHVVIDVKSFAELSKDELYDILKLRQEVFVVEQECAYLDSDGLDKEALHVILTSRGVLSGYARVLQPKAQYYDYVAIGRVLVAFPERGKNYGAMVMKKAIECAHNHWSMPIKISAQTYTLPFYEDLGFVPVGEGYLEDGIPHHAMIHTQVI